MLYVKETHQNPNCSISKENAYIWNGVKRVVSRMKSLLWRDSRQLSATRVHSKCPLQQLQREGNETTSTVLTAH